MGGELAIGINNRKRSAEKHTHTHTRSGGKYLKPERLLLLQAPAEHVALGGEGARRHTGEPAEPRLGARPPRAACQRMWLVSSNNPSIVANYAR